MLLDSSRGSAWDVTDITVQGRGDNGYRGTGMESVSACCRNACWIRCTHDGEERNKVQCTKVCDCSWSACNRQLTAISLIHPVSRTGATASPPHCLAASLPDCLT
jgi:hypothetical protein